MPVLRRGNGAGCGRGGHGAGRGRGGRGDEQRPRVAVLLTRHLVECLLTCSQGCQGDIRVIFWQPWGKFEEFEGICAISERSVVSVIGICLICGICGDLW